MPKLDIKGLSMKITDRPCVKFSFIYDFSSILSHPEELTEASDKGHSKIVGSCEVEEGGTVLGLPSTPIWSQIRSIEYIA